MLWTNITVKISQKYDLYFLHGSWINGKNVKLKFIYSPCKLFFYLFFVEQVLGKFLSPIFTCICEKSQIAYNFDIHLFFLCHLLSLSCLSASVTMRRVWLVWWWGSGSCWSGIHPLFHPILPPLPMFCWPNGAASQVQLLSQVCRLFLLKIYPLWNSNFSTF